MYIKFCQNSITIVLSMLLIMYCSKVLMNSRFGYHKQCIYGSFKEEKYHSFHGFMKTTKVSTINTK